MTISESAISALAALFLLSGCSSAARYIDPKSADEGLVTISAVNTYEWNSAAAQAIQSLIASGALKRTDGRTPVVMVSRIRNRTMLHLHTNILTDKIRQAILASGQAAITSAVGYGGNIDPAVRRVRELENDDLFNQETVQKRGTVTAPDLSLAGSINQQTVYSGRIEESYFQFHLVLTDLTTGIAVWETTVDFSKQATHPLF